MAGNIKGITIEIDGNTQPLKSALKGVDKAANDATRELKQIDKALKFDTGNVTLLAQKQEVLQKQVSATKEKLETLKGAQAQVEAQFKSGDIGAEQYRAFQREVETTQNVLKAYENKLEGVNRALESNGNSVETNRSKLNQLQSEQSQLASESEKVVSSFKLQESQLGQNASESEKLALAQKKIASQSEIVEKQIANLERQLELTKSEYGENSVEANKLEKSLNETKTAFNQLQNEMEEMSGASQSAKSGLEETNQLLKADILMEYSDKLQEVSQKLIDLGQQALDAFRQVDEGMDIIVTKTGATGESLDQMTDIAKQVAVNIAGAGFEEAGSAIGEVNTQFGLMGDALKTASEDLLKFSQINGADVTTSTIQSKQAIEAYGLSVDSLSSVLDTTTYVAQLTGVSVGDLMTKAIDGAPQIKALGLAFDEGVSLIGQFEKAGVDSSAALSSLSKAAVNYAKDGKSLSDGLRGTIEAIQNSTSETESLTLASEIFGSKAAPRMVDAIKRGAFAFDDFAGTAENAAGVVSSTFEATLDPIDQFETAQEELTLAMADIGGVISETLAPIFSSLADIVRDLAALFSGLPEPIRQFVVIMGGVVVIIGTLLPVFLALQAAAMPMGTSIGGMVLSFLPVVGIVLGVIAVVAALVLGIKYLWETNEGFREAINVIWEGISSFLGGILQAIVDLIMSIWTPIVSWWNENQELLKTTAETVWNAIQAVIQVVMDTLGPWIQASWQNIQTTITAAWEIIKTVVETAINVVLGIITAVMQMINGDWSGAWETIKGILSTVWEGMKSIVSTVVNAIAQIISSTWNGISSTLSGILNAISSTISSIWNAISSTVSGVLNGISSTISSVWNGIKETISGAINAAKDAVSNAINAIKGIMNFSWSLPRLKLPRITISGGFSLMPPRVPSFGLEWFAKGGILTQPTIFGMNGNNLMVGGEAGNEAILPLNEKTLGAIGRGIAQTLGGQAPVINISISGNIIREEADINKIADSVARRISDELRRKNELLGGIT